MALIKCPECNKEVSDKATVCIHCGYPLPKYVDISAEIRSIESQLSGLRAVLQQKKSYGEIYDKIKNLMSTIHQKINYEPNDQYDDVLFIMTKCLLNNSYYIIYSTVAQFFGLINMKCVTQKGYSKSIEIIQNADHIVYWFPLYQFLENAPDEDKKNLESLLQEPDAFGQPKINTVNSFAERYLAGKLNISYNPQNEKSIPKCPTCGSANINKISGAKKAAGFLAVGVFSSNLGKTMECKNCGYKW